MSCRLLHLDGRPAFFGLGSSASSTAHCPSVRSNRLVTGTLATRSPEDRTSWSKNHLPETSPHIDHRHTEHQVSVRLLKHGLARVHEVDALAVAKLDRLTRSLV